MMDTIMRAMMDDARFSANFAKDLKESMSEIKKGIEAMKDSEIGFIMQKAELENFMKALSAYVDRSFSDGEDNPFSQVEKLREMLRVKYIIFPDGENVIGKGIVGSGWDCDCKQEEMKDEGNKEDTVMNKSTQLEALMYILEGIRISILMGCSSDDALIGALERVQATILNASSEVFSDEKEILMALLEDTNNLHQRTITRSTFNERFAKHMNDLGDRLKTVEEEKAAREAEAKAAKEAETKAAKEVEAKEAFKNALLRNIDILYEAYKRNIQEDTAMTKSPQFEKLMENLATARIEIAIGCQSEFMLCEAIDRLRSVVQDAVGSESFADEKKILMILLGDMHNLQMRDITRDTFGKCLDKHMNDLSTKFKALKEDNDKEAFKNKLLQNIDILYDVYRQIMQETGYYGIMRE